MWFCTPTWDVLPWHGIVIGLIAGAVCYWACVWLKQRLKYDDTLDVFGVHGVGGILGTLLAGVFATGAVSATAASPDGLRGLIDGNPAQLGIQLAGVVVTVAWCAVATWGILMAIKAFIGLRVDTDQEREGQDLALHGESIHQ